MRTDFLDNLNATCACTDDPDSLSFGINTLAGSDMIWYVCKAGPDRSEQHFHALAAGGGLDAGEIQPQSLKDVDFLNSPEPDNGENTSRQDYEVAKVISEGHPREDGEGCVSSGGSHKQYSSCPSVR